MRQPTKEREEHQQPVNCPGVDMLPWGLQLPTDYLSLPGEL